MFWMHDCGQSMSMNEDPHYFSGLGGCTYIVVRSCAVCTRSTPNISSPSAMALKRVYVRLGHAAPSSLFSTSVIGCLSLSCRNYCESNKVPIVMYPTSY